MPDKKQVKSFVGKSSLKHPEALSVAEGVKELRVAAPGMNQENKRDIFEEKKTEKKKRKKPR